MDDLAALRLQIEWGADEALEDAPVDRLRGAATPPPQPSPAPREKVGEREPPSQAAATTSTPTERALQAATAASTLDELRAAIAAFDGCALRHTASHLVFAEGDPAASLLLIGEPPSADDDRSGTPFAGTAGAYLDRMLASIGLARAQLMLAPLLPWRPPGDRPPTSAELTICLPFLHRVITLVAPRRLLLLGALPARTLLPQHTARRRPRGSWMEVSVGGHTIPALPSFSPAELMRQAKDRRSAWADLRLLRRTLDADAAAA